MFSKNTENEKNNERTNYLDIAECFLNIHF